MHIIVYENCEVESQRFESQSWRRVQFTSDCTAKGRISPSVDTATVPVQVPGVQRVRALVRAIHTLCACHRFIDYTALALPALSVCGDEGDN